MNQKTTSPTVGCVALSRVTSLMFTKRLAIRSLQEHGDDLYNIQLFKGRDLREPFGFESLSCFCCQAYFFNIVVKWLFRITFRHKHPQTPKQDNHSGSLNCKKKNKIKMSDEKRMTGDLLHFLRTVNCH
jgi:hypothetical protein